MDESEVAGFRECITNGGGEDGRQGTALAGGEWLRISYERRDGWIQVQYLLFGAGGCVHSFIDGRLPREAERWHNHVYETSRPDYGINRVSMVSQGGWLLTRMVDEVDAKGARRLVEKGLTVG